MINELIEKINDLDREFDNEHQNNKETNDYYINGWKIAIKSCLNIIKESKPQVLDKPDSEGWWWTYDEKGLYDCFQVISSDGLLVVRDQRRNLYFKLCSKMLFGLKWIKADIPKHEGLHDSIILTLSIAST